jgi:hypothetical protein
MNRVGKLKAPPLNQITGERPRCQRCDKPLTACTFRFRVAGHLDHTPTADEARAIVEAKAWPDHWGAEMALKDGYDAGRAFRVWHLLDYESRPITEVHYWRGFYAGEGWGQDHPFPLFCNVRCALTFAALCWEVGMRIKREEAP